jgi:hypothetical protein
MLNRRYLLLPGPAAKPVSFLQLTKHVLVDHVLTDRTAIKNAQDIPRGLFAHPIDGFPGNACDMRRDDDIGKFGQRIGYRRRLLLEDIEPRAGKPA